MCYVAMRLSSFELLRRQRTCVLKWAFRITLVAAIAIAAILLGSWLLRDDPSRSSAPASERMPAAASRRPDSGAPIARRGNADTTEYASAATQRLLEQFEIQLAQSMDPHNEDHERHHESAASTLSELRPLLYDDPDGRSQYAELERRLELAASH